MKILMTTSAVALILGSAALAQDQPPQEPEAQQEQLQAEQQPAEQEQQVAAEQPFVEPTEEDLFATRLVGMAVYTPEDAAQVEGLADVTDHQIDTAQLADFVIAGHIADVMLTRGGEPRAIVIALTAAQEPGPAQTPPATVGVPGAGIIAEIAIDVGQVMFFADETVPDLTFAVVGVPAEQLREAPVIQRPLIADPMAGEAAATMTDPATMPGWRMGRAPMAPPGVAIEGYTQVPAAEFSVDNLLGATVFGAENQSIGSIGDVVVDATGAVEYVTVDVGGFLGIGTREVAIGFDEMTVLRDPAWDDLQVHIAATQAQLEQLPEHQDQPAQQPQQN